MNAALLNIRRKFTDEALLLACILAIGAAVRFWHLGWSLPDMYEEAYPFAVAWKFWRWGTPGISFDPNFFHYPALTFYPQFALQALHYGLGHLTGAYSDLSAFQKAYEQDPTVFIALARGLSAALDLGAVLLLYACTRRWFGTTAALLAACIMACNPLFIMESQLVNVDTPMTFFVLLAFTFLTRLLDNPDGRTFLLCGVGIGLAASSKYTGALLVVPLAVTAFWRTRDLRKAGLLLLAFITAGAVFFLLNPYIILHPEQFFRDFSFEQRHMATGHLGVDSKENSLVYYLVDALPRIFGWAFLLAVGAGTALGVRAKEERLFLTGVFPLTLLAVIGTWEMRADRYLMPMLPFLIIIGSYGAAECWRLGRKLFVARWAPVSGLPKVIERAAAFVLLAGLLAMPLASVVAYHRSLGTPDTRTEVKEWIVRSLPARATVVTGPFGIRLPEERFTMLMIPFSPTGSEAFAPFYAPGWYEDFDLLIASDYDFGRFSIEPERYKEILAQYARLRSTWRLAAEFHPRDGQNGPTVWLYRPPERPAAEFDAALFGSLSSIAETTLVVNFAENLASALFDKGNMLKARQMADVALALAPDHTRLVNSFAWALFKAGKFQEAMSMADRSLASQGSQPEMVALRGSIFLRTGHEVAAETELKRAIGMNSRQEIPYLDLELLYRNHKDREKQIAILRQYLSILTPGSENAKRTEAYLRQLE